MRGVAGAILILAGAILIAAGIVADAVGTTDTNGTLGYVLGSVIGVVGLLMVAAGTLKQGWDAIPVDDHKTNGETTGGTTADR